MSLQHFFLENQDLGSEVETSGGGSFALNLSAEDLHHAKVLRLKPGEHIGVIDSQLRYFRCEIVDFKKELIVKNVTITPKSLSQGADPEMTKPGSRLWLAAGIAKGNKLDDVIRACTEIGVYGFIPVDFARSVSKLDAKKEAAKNERWKKIAKSAAMQSGQFAIPKVNQSVNVDVLCEQLTDFDAVFICWEEAEDMQKIVKVCNEIKSKDEEQNIAIVIGPEGGITSDEVNQLKNCNKNAHVVSIGNSILRTETAGIAASAIIKFNLSC